MMRAARAFPAILLLLVCAPAARSTTKVFFNQSLNAGTGLNAFTYMNTVRSTQAFKTSVTTTTASGTKIQTTATAGGAIIEWISQPLAASQTISGTITNNIWAKESVATANCTLRVEIGKYSGGSEGTPFSTTSFGSELTTTIAANNWTDTTPTSTTFAAGDRIAVLVYIVNFGTMGAGTATIDYGGPTNAANGDTYVQFNETFSFQAEPQIIEGENGDGGAAASTQIFWNANVAAGNLVLACSVWDAQVTTATITDSASNSYTSIFGPINIGITRRMQCWYAKNVSSNSSVTVSYSPTTVGISFVEAINYSGLDTTSPLDSSNNVTGSGTSVSSPSLTPTATDILFVGPVGFDGGSNPYTTPSNWIAVSSDASFYAQNRTVYATGAVTSTATASNSNNWDAGIIALKSAFQPAATSTTQVGGFLVGP